jgi:hypothetical protein
MFRVSSVPEVVEYLPSKCKVWNSTHSTAKKTKQKLILLGAVVNTKASIK